MKRPKQPPQDTKEAHVTHNERTQKSGQRRDRKKNPRRLRGQIQLPSYQSRDKDTTPSRNQNRKQQSEENPVQ
jgi:hypothetical protein